MKQLVVKSTTNSIESQGSSAKENDLEDDDTSNDSHSSLYCDENSTQNGDNSSDDTD